MLYIEDALKKFNELPEDIILEVDSPRVAEKMEALERKYRVKLSGLLIFAAVGEIMNDDIEGYLKREFGMDSAVAANLKRDIEEQILNPLVRRLYFLNDDPATKNITFEEEKNLAEHIFSEDLIRDIGNNPIIINAINKRIFYILSHDLNFRKTLEDALYRNEEKLTHKTFALEDKPHRPTVGNWLKDFIKWHGTEPFDSVVLSQYLTTSENVRRLDRGEKESVKKLLQLYRNIKFFPASMPTDDGEGWEIIPTGEKVEKLTKARSVSGPPRTEEEMEEDELRTEEEQYGEGTLEREVIEEELDKKKKTRELEIVAEHYKEGSLERRALEEEIEKLKS